MQTIADFRLRLWLIPTVAVLFAGAAGGSIASAQDEDAWSIEEFVQKRSKWSLLKGTTLKVEGRYPVMGERRMSFSNCDGLIFEFADGVRQTTSRSKTVQVSGSLDSRQGKLVFVVSRIKATPSDADRLADRRVRLPQDDAAPWYELADWADGRGRFYEDDDLIAAAAELRSSAIQIEYRQIGINEIEPLYALERKAAKLGAPTRIRDEMVHDAVRRELRVARERGAKQRDVALTHLLKRLPGAARQVLRDDAVNELQKEYERNPLDVFRAADAATRSTLNRLLYSAAFLERIELDAADDGRNGFEIAGRIEATLPEFADLAEEHRQREIEWQLQHLEELSRDEMLALGERLEARDRAARASESRRAWLAAQEPALREQGASGLLDLAKEYVALLDDADAAATIYMELFQSRTGQQTARAELVKLGYQFDGTKWRKSDEAALETTPDAISRGILRRGMTAEQVRAALGKPPSVVKIAVRNQVCELWVYPEHGVAIELRRRGAQGDSIAREISDLFGP